jgi:hypothetical protein
MIGASDGNNNTSEYTCESKGGRLWLSCTAARTTATAAAAAAEGKQQQQFERSLRLAAHHGCVAVEQTTYVT